MGTGDGRPVSELKSAMDQLLKVRKIMDDDDDDVLLLVFMRYFLDCVL